VPSEQQPVGDPGASIAQRSAQALDRSVPNRSASVANPIRLWAGMDQYGTRYPRGHADLDYKDVDMQGAQLWENPEDSLDYLELAAQNLDSRAARIVSEALRQFGLRLSTPFHSRDFRSGPTTGRCRVLGIPRRDRRSDLFVTGSRAEGPSRRANQARPGQESCTQSNEEEIAADVDDRADSGVGSSDDGALLP